MLDPVRNKINTMRNWKNAQVQERGLEKPQASLLQKPKPDGTPTPGQEMPSMMERPQAPGLQLQQGSPFQQRTMFADKQRMLGKFQSQEQQENRFVLPEQQAQEPGNPMQQFIQQARAKGFPEQKIMSFLAQKMRGGM